MSYKSIGPSKISFGGKSIGECVSLEMSAGDVASMQPCETYFVDLCQPISFVVYPFDGPPVFSINTGVLDSIHDRWLASLPSRPG
jgi:hypothetical protein